MNTICKLQRWTTSLAISFVLAMLTTALLAQAVPEQAKAPSFTLVADGKNVGTFKHASGLSNPVIETEAAERGQHTVKRLPARTQSGKITLSEGDPQSTQYVYKWHQAVVQGNMAAARRNVSLVLHAPDGKQLGRYDLKNAWPSKVTMGKLETAKTGSPGIETLELEYESITRME